MSIEYQEREPAQATKPEPKINTEEVITMSDSKTFFENPLGAGAGLSAGVGGLIGAALGGNGGLLGGNRENIATLDQVDARFNSLQNQISGDQIEDRIVGVKDAVNHASSHNALALCGLGHTIQAGFSDLKNTVVSEASRGRELQLADSLAQARAALAAAESRASHTATQVMISNLVAK